MERERDDDAIESEAMLAADRDRDEVAIEIDIDGDRNGITTEIKAMLANAQPLFTKECCIYRVPHEICEFRQDKYTPKVVSIGPFHHGDTKLLPMQSQKQIYCLKFIEKVSLDGLVSRVQELEPKVRRCYSDSIKLSKEEFVKVILVDCGFIIELLFRSYLGGDRTQDDVILLAPWLEDNIRLDLLLLENQLPFFILDELYNLAFPSRLNDKQPSLLTLALRYFRGYIGENLSSTCSVEHFTDLLRTSHLQPQNIRPRRVPLEFDHYIRSANELNKAGVKFKVNDTSTSFLDLQFSRRCLRIPVILMMDAFEPLLRNMVALEQWHYPNESHIADYMLFMNFLINTDKDVNVLVKTGIIVNMLGDSDEVAELFKGFGKTILPVNFNEDYLHIVQKLKHYYDYYIRVVNSRRVNLLLTLVRDYCDTPWKALASFGGIVLIILTFIQTVFSIKK